MSLVPNVLILTYLVLFFNQLGDMAIFGLGAAFLIGNILLITIFIQPLRKRGFRFRPRLNLCDPALKQILKLSPMFLVSAWLFPINNMVHLWVIPNRYNVEAIVELRAANTIYIVLTGFFVLSVTNMLFPKLSKEAAKASMGKKSEFAETISGTISAVAYILMPMSMGLWLLREPISRFAFLGGEFTEASAVQVAYALGFLAIGMLGFGLTTILSRAFFSIMNGKVPMIVSLVAIAINIVASFVLIDFMGLGGIALAQSISVTTAGLAMLFILSRNFTVFSRAAISNFLKMTFSAAFMAVILFGVMYLINDLPYILIIGIISLLGVAMYFIIGSLIRINEVKIAKDLILARFRKDA